MLHNLTIGASMSGKTTLNKALAAGLRSRGIRVVVLDPLRDKWDADEQTHDPEKFLRLVRTTDPQRTAVFVDESASALDKYDTRFDVLATTGRHLGCLSHFISHRLTQLSPTIRAQCMRRWIFRCDPRDARELAMLHNEPKLSRASELPQLSFFYLEPFKPLRSGSITFVRGKPRVKIDAR